MSGFNGCGFFRKFREKLFLNENCAIMPSANSDLETLGDFGDFPQAKRPEKLIFDCGAKVAHNLGINYLLTFSR
jgi:hypothetical protein